MSEQSKTPVQEPPKQEAEKTVVAPAPVVTETPEQLHDAAIAAVDAWEKTPTDETKTAAKNAVAKAKEALKATKKVVPEKYDLKLPEGSTLEATHLEKVAAYAKERGLSNEDAQALVKRDSEIRKTYAEAQDAEIKKTIESWIPMAKADQEVGGDNFNRKVELSKRLVARIDSDGKVAKYLNESGLGNHPETIRILSRIGELMTDDQLVMGGTQTTTTKKSHADVLYGDEKEPENKGE